MKFRGDEEVRSEIRDNNLSVSDIVKIRGMVLFMNFFKDKFMGGVMNVREMEEGTLSTFIKDITDNEGVRRINKERIIRDRDIMKDKIHNKEGYKNVINRE